MHVVKHRTVLSYCLVFFLSFLLLRCADDPSIEPQPPGSNEVNDPGGEIEQPQDPPAACSTCTFVVPGDMRTVDGKLLGFNPGDVICLSAAIKYSGSITFTNVNGTADKPIVITNCGGPVNLVVSNRNFNVKISRSKYFH